MIARVAWGAALLAALLAGVSTGVKGHSHGAAAMPAEAESAAVRFDEPGWDAGVIERMPEEVSALGTGPGPCPGAGDLLYVGTSPTGGIYELNPLKPPQTYHTVAYGMGDSVRFGTISVASLAVRDLDRDGTPELLAATSQITPRGRPRLYIWSLTTPARLRGVARPDISSSWSHGLGFIGPRDNGTESTFLTFCGFGEVVEYQFAGLTDERGFTAETIAWKRVGQLPASGEQVASADADNDGEVDLCVASGYAPGKAALRVFESEGRGAPLRLKQTIDERGRFGNLRFLVAEADEGRARDVVAWWCTGHARGDCEIVRYRLGPGEVRRRDVVARGNADDLWPQDGQAAGADLDGDGRPEVWFATYTGHLWCYDPGRAPALRRVLRAPGGLGQLAAGHEGASGGLCLYLANGTNVLRLRRSGR